VVIHACNSSTQEAEARGLKAQSQPTLNSKTLSQKKKKKEEELKENMDKNVKEISKK
jgi:hypothetical protein